MGSAWNTVVFKTWHGPPIEASHTSIGKVVRLHVCIGAVLGLDVVVLHEVEAGKDTGTGNTTEDVGTGTLEEGR